MINFTKFLLLEKNSSIYYHDTNTRALEQILVDNKFILRSALLKGADSRTDNLKYPYFMSLSRNRANSYRTFPSATLVMDGSLLNANYKVVPIDYWGQEFKKLGRAEMEDRLLSRNPIIKNAKKYIKEIHVYVDKHTLENEKQNSIYRILGYFKDDDPIKVYYYDDRKAIYTLNKSKSVEKPDTENAGFVDRSRMENTYDKFSDFLDFLKTGHTSKYYKEWLRHPRDFVYSGDSELHNFYNDSGTMQGRQLVARLVEMMRAEKTSNPREFLIKRYSKITKTPEETVRLYLK